MPRRPLSLSLSIFEDATGAGGPDVGPDVYYCRAGSDLCTAPLMCNTRAPPVEGVSGGVRTVPAGF